MLPNLAGCGEHITRDEQDRRGNDERNCDRADAPEVDLTDQGEAMGESGLQLNREGWAVG